MRLYFDATSGLLLRRTMSMPTMIGIIPDQIDLEDYREADGLKFRSQLAPQYLKLETRPRRERSLN
jgi:hypothetical protein